MSELQRWGGMFDSAYLRRVLRDATAHMEYPTEVAPLTESQWNYLLGKQDYLSPDYLEKLLKEAGQVQELKERLKQRHPKLKWIEAKQ